MKRFALQILIITFAYFNQAAAANLGTVGETFPIAEKDLLAVIADRLQVMKSNGKLAELQSTWQKNVEHYAEAPQSAELTTTTVVPAVYYYNPTVVLSKDIHDSEGGIVAKAGTSYNPLTLISLHKRLLFLDATDPKQLEWAHEFTQQSAMPVKWTLVNGTIKAAHDVAKVPIYFDQSGSLVKRFGIKHVPACVEQEGEQLKITEYVP